MLRTINSLGLMGNADMHISQTGHSSTLDRWRYCCVVICVTTSAVCSFVCAPAIRRLLSAQIVSIGVAVAIKHVYWASVSDYTVLWLWVEPGVMHIGIVREPLCHGLNC